MESTPSSPTIFYSWQSDLPKEVCRNFLEDAVARAAKRLCNECEIEQDPRVDRDTKNEPGSPDIVEIIERKIEHATAFVGDVSLVARNVDGKKSLPNASVATETGYAIASLGPRRVVLPFNTAFGDPDDLPFDLRNRRVLPYELAPRREGETEEEWREWRSAARASLVEDLVAALRVIFEKGAETPPPTVLERMMQMESQHRDLEKRVGPRTLSEHERTVLERHATSASSTLVLEISTALLDPEAGEYGMAFADLFKRVGWKVDINDMMTISVSGVAVVVVNPDSPPRPAILLLEAFQELSVPFQVMSYQPTMPGQVGFDLTKNPDAAVLLIGKKS